MWKYEGSELELELEMTSNTFENLFLPPLKDFNQNFILKYYISVMLIAQNNKTEQITKKSVIFVFGKKFN